MKRNLGNSVLPLPGWDLALGTLTYFHQDLWKRRGVIWYSGFFNHLFSVRSEQSLIHKRWFNHCPRCDLMSMVTTDWGGINQVLSSVLGERGSNSISGENLSAPLVTLFLTLSHLCLSHPIPSFLHIVNQLNCFLPDYLHPSVSFFFSFVFFSFFFQGNRF